jgi:glycine/D-amino acid oxidase-like deaminating enzyme
MSAAFKVKNNKPILIIGQGLSGTILAHQALKAGYEVEIWDSPTTHFTSSWAAGGIFNPVTGRKLEATWLAEEIFTYLFPFYEGLEKTLGARFFHPMPLFRPFANVEMKQWLLDRKSQIDHDFLRWTDEGVWVSKSGWVDVATLLSASSNYFAEKKILKNRLYSESEFSNISVHVDRIICCEGFHGQQNSLWKGFGFLPAKGELLRFKSNQPSEDYILNKNGFMLPLGNHEFKVGATYRWDEYGPDSVPEAQLELKQKMASFQIDDYEEVEKLVGVRPATQDRRPLVGMLPDLNVGIFNGFGSKGVSLIPYFAEAFVGEWFGKKMVHPEASIRRFSHLFSV